MVAPLTIIGVMLAVLLIGGIMAAGIVTWNSSPAGALSTGLPDPSTTVYLSTFGNGVNQYLWLDVALYSVVSDLRFIFADVVWINGSVAISNQPLTFTLQGAASDVVVTIKSISGFNTLPPPYNSLVGVQYSDTSIAFLLAQDLQPSTTFLTQVHATLEVTQRITFVVTYRSTE